MFLFSISLLLILLSITFHKKAKINNVLIALSICFVVIIYYVLATNSTNPQFFFPKKELTIYSFAGNYYNWLTSNLLNYKLDLGVNPDFVKSIDDIVDNNLLKSNEVELSIKMLYDTSIYNSKVFLYFGITPVILFYLPFYLITKYYISDQIVTLFLSLFIFLVQLLIYKKILNLLNKQEYLNSVTVLILGLCSGVILTYISITIHLIPILTSIACLLLVIYIFLLLFNSRYIALKMFSIGLFLALSVGCRPSNVVPVMVILALVLYKVSIKEYWKEYICLFVPVILYAIILALYNYFRFDSIFNFGYIYQFSPLYQKGIAQNLNHSFLDFIKHMFFNAFHLPIFTTINPLCIFKNYENISYFEPMIGGLIISPTILFLLLLRKFLKKNFNKNKYICFLFVVMVFIGFYYFVLNSYIGSNARFIAEYLFLLLIPAIISFSSFIETEENIIFRKLAKFLFFVLLIFGLYVNINLINCIFLMSKNGMI